MQGMRRLKPWLLARWCSAASSAALNPAFELPVRENLVYLHNEMNNAEVYLLGTLHVSQRNPAEVKELINLVKPNIVAVELCPDRIGSLYEEKVEPPKRIIREFWDCPGSVGARLVHVFFSRYYRMFQDAGMTIAQEFTVAGAEAHKIGAEIHLIDQDVAVTREKLKSALRMPTAFKLLRKLLKEKEFEFIADALARRDPGVLDKFNSRTFARDLVEFVEGEFPEVVQAILRERDEIMTRRLLTCEGRIVAVVGLGHMDGIEKTWDWYQKNKGSFDPEPEEYSVILTAPE